MNIVDTHVQNIRPDPDSNKMLGNVTFYISGGMGDRCDIANYDCTCAIPTGASSNDRLTQIKHGLRNDALRQARRMPEVLSGEETLILLTPQDQSAA